MILWLITGLVWFLAFLSFHLYRHYRYREERAVIRRMKAYRDRD